MAQNLKIRTKIDNTNIFELKLINDKGLGHNFNPYQWKYNYD